MAEPSASPPPVDRDESERSSLSPLPRMRRTASPFTDVERIGMRRAPLSDVYHQVMDMSWGRFMAVVAVGYLAVNCLFALAYLAGGDCIENARRGSFHDAFFFSVQTMATIGYGKLVPRTSYANAMVALEALCGIVSTAMGTGLMFARFARPTARVLFSRVAVITKRDGVASLMFRMANERGNQIVEASLRVVLARNERTREGELVRRFYDLPLSRDRNSVFALSWTAIHHITEESELRGATYESLAESDTLLIVSLMGIDETSAQTVHARHVYYPEDLRWNERLVDILGRTPDGRRTIDYRLFHDTTPNGVM